MSTPPEKQRISARDKKEGTRLIPIQKGPCRMPSPSDGICPSPLTTHATSEHDRGSDTHHEQDDAARLGDDRMVRSPDRVQGHVLVLQWDLSAVLVGRALTVLLGVPVLEPLTPGFSNRCFFAVFPVFPRVPAWFAIHFKSLQITSITARTWAKCGHGFTRPSAVRGIGAPTVPRHDSPRHCRA